MKELGAPEVLNPPGETLVATINKIPEAYLRETLKNHPDYESNQEANSENAFIRTMLIVKRGSTDLNTAEVRYAKIDTASPVSLVPEETLAGLGIVPYRFGSHALTGLVQSAIVEPVGLEPIFWFADDDRNEKPRIFQTTFMVLPKGTTRSFDFLLGADWLLDAKLTLAQSNQNGQHTQAQSSVLYLRVLNQVH